MEQVIGNLKTDY